MRPVKAVYLIHLDHPFKHASHYVGWSEFVPARFQYHKSGQGSRFLRAVNETGIDYRIVAIYIGADKTFERALHDAKQSVKYCPVCSGDRVRKFTPPGYIVTRPKSRAYRQFDAIRFQVANLYEDILRPWQFREVIHGSVPLVPARSNYVESLPW